jgi:hypothetical protein
VFISAALDLRSNSKVAIKKLQKAFEVRSPVASLQRCVAGVTNPLALSVGLAWGKRQAPILAKRAFRELNVLRFLKHENVIGVRTHHLLGRLAVAWATLTLP